MNKKTNFLKSGLMIWAILCWSVSLTSATNFKINVDGLRAMGTAITQNITPLHFADNWNDFWWFIYLDINNEYWATSEWNQYEIESGSEQYVCKQQVKWFYYNAERWEILWKLHVDEEYNKIWWEDTEPQYWWIYTKCMNKQDYEQKIDDCVKYNEDETSRQNCIDNVNKDVSMDNGYYGAITHIYEGKEYALIVGVDYDTQKTWILPKTDFKKTFIRWNNQVPVGFVYDYKGWIWFAGCKIEGNNGLKQIIDIDLEKNFSRGDDAGKKVLKSENGLLNCEKAGTAADSLSRVLVEWIVWLNSKSQGIQWNQSSDKMQYFSSANIDNITMINYAKRKSEILCRWKWWKANSNNEISCSSDVTCIDPKSNNNPTLILNNSCFGDNNINIKKTLIVKNANVKISPSNSCNNTNKYYDIFVNGWDLIIEEPENQTKCVFDMQWSVASSNTEWFKRWVESCGTETEDGGIENIKYPCDVYSDKYSWVWVFINWNFIVDGQVGGVKDESNNYTTLKNKYFIYWKFTTKNDSVDTLSNMFAWRCNNGFSSDGSYCPPSTENYSNPYANASLVVIDRDWQSPLLR